MSEISPELLILVVVGISYFYIFIYQYFAYKKCNYFHETGAAMIVGIIIGIPIFFFNTEIFESQKIQQITRNIIILLLIPPMLFEDGYNIPKRKFFQNIFYINLFGIFGTILNFATIFTILFFFNHFNLIILLWHNQVINLSNFQMLLFASVMCSIDTVVPERIVNPERYPKLFSIIFGESIIKDTITFTLVSAILLIESKLTNQDDIVAEDFGIVLLYFLAVVAGSVLIGFLSAVFTTMLFKNFRFLLFQKGIAEIGLIMMTGYAAYIIGEQAKCSGVISMLFCGIMLSHFNLYNLTPEGKASTKFAVTTLALITEGLLFCLLGAYILNIQASNITNDNDSGQQIAYYSFSWTFLLIGFICLFVGRFINIFLMSLLGKFILGKKKWRITLYECEILFVSGLARGAVPFALILTTPITQGSSQIAAESMINTVVIIVFISSLFFNSIMPKIIRNRLKKLKILIKQDPHNPNVYDSMLAAYKENQEMENMKQILYRPSKTKQEKVDLQAINFYGKMKNTTYKYWRKCEEGFMKPLLIYNYYERKEKIKSEKREQRRKECEQYWERLQSEGSMSEHEKEYNIIVDQFIIDNDIEEEESKSRGEQVGVELKEREYRSQRNYSVGNNLINKAQKQKLDTRLSEQFK